VSKHIESARGDIEGPIFWRRLRNDIDEREGDQRKYYLTRTMCFSKTCSRASPEIKNRTSKRALV